MATTDGETGAAAAQNGGREIPKRDWPPFLIRFSDAHHGWAVRLETHDRVTGESVMSAEMALESIEYDLEDEEHPRINVIVRFDNKSMKHILFLPSQMILRTTEAASRESLHIRTLNTETTVHLKAPAD